MPNKLWPSLFPWMRFKGFTRESLNALTSEVFEVDELENLHQKSDQPET